MKASLISLSIIGMILFSSCKDDGTSTPPAVGFSVKISVTNPSGSPVSGLRISTWNHLSISIGRDYQNTIAGAVASPTSVTSIYFIVPVLSKVTLAVFDFDGSLVSTLVNQETIQTGSYSVDWAVQAKRPTRVYKYRLIARDTLNGSTLFRDSLYGVLWQPDAEQSILGWTPQNGSYETSDKLLFPNALDLPRLIHTSNAGPESLGTFTIRDTVTIVLTDTTTHRQMTFERVIKKGFANDIQLVWNPTLAKQFTPESHRIEDQREIFQTRRLATGLLDWKLNQNFPNPFN